MSASREPVLVQARKKLWPFAMRIAGARAGANALVENWLALLQVRLKLEEAVWESDTVHSPAPLAMAALSAANGYIMKFLPAQFTVFLEDNLATT